MEYRRITAALLLSSLAFTAACDDDDDPTGPPPQFANVRVVNASSLPANASVNLVAGGQTLTASTVAFGQQSSACVRVPVSTDQLAFRTAGGTTDIATVGAPTGGFQANQNYTVVLFGNAAGAAPNAALFSDPVLAASTNNNQLRFINATNSAGNVYVTAPGTNITGTSTVDVTNLAPGAASSFGTGTATSAFGTFPTANTQVRLFNTNATTFTTPRVDFAIGSTALNSNRVGTVVLSEAGNPAGSATFVSTPCS